MRVTVCELRNDPAGLEEDWRSLAAHVRDAASDLVLLPEMPFHPWLASTRDVDPMRWQASVAAHDAWAARLHELGAATVVATRPVVDGGDRFNQALVWQADSGDVPVSHRKQYLPEEAGFWEALWYSPGPAGTECVTAGKPKGPRAVIGFAICTEMWFLHRARAYSKQGVQLLASPRATLLPSVDKWLAGGRAAAVVSGAFSLSSNLAGSAGKHGDWGGGGWIVEPEEGEVLATTSRASPFATVEIDLAVADVAKSTYPRYVTDPRSPDLACRTPTRLSTRCSRSTGCRGSASTA